MSDFTIVAGDTLTLTLNLTLSGVDISSATSVKVGVKQRETDDVELLSMEATDGSLTAYNTTGVTAVLTATGTATNALNPNSNYLWDALVTVGSDMYRTAEKELTVRKGITNNS